MNSQGYVRIVGRAITWFCYNTTTGEDVRFRLAIDLKGTPFTFSDTMNKFTATGCDAMAMIQGSGPHNYTGGCVSFCATRHSVIDGSCSGVGCCQASVPRGLQSLKLNFSSIRAMTGSKNDTSGTCSKAFIVDKDWFKFSAEDLVGNANDEYRPVVLEWSIGNQTCEEVQRRKPPDYACVDGHSRCYNSGNGIGYRCNCSEGYAGNPYVPGGCQGLGLALLVMLLLVGGGAYWGVKRRKTRKLKQKYFLQNGGLLLQQHISSRQAAARIFSSEELERATENFNETRVLGHGGYGTVYKGALSDQRVVAIKKSKLVDQSQIQQFINEVVILSQINHRNVVKLLGCCLETQVPLLVYEYISNGTLSHHVHGSRVPMSWENRLRIAVETAGALAYLHSASAKPIIHRDVKSANILLDEEYTAKVSDFGASRLIPYDQTHMTTLVQGTLGYLDPEYFQTSILTEKSDVYSFGVVLMELLMREKPISPGRPEEERNLAFHFIMLLEENRLLSVVDRPTVEEAGERQLYAVAQLARRCLNLRGEDRPTMKEVAVELDALGRLLMQHSAREESRKPGRWSLSVPREFRGGGTGVEVGSSAVFSESSFTGR
ncbi:hypothetical protein BHM03_00021246 [Ensete ventricosum]|nr:hypothetical protein BHM03_00021246 [Ensete ventricosum]